MSLSERKEKIIQAIVDEYIDTCEPISSSDIQKNYLPELSSATIRNELSALSEMGYLDQPHTSAGRVPTAQAYQLYFEKLMSKKALSKSEEQLIRKAFEGKINEIDEVLRSTARVISEITSLTGIAYVEDIKKAKISSIKIFRITEDSAIVIIVTSLGVLKDSFIGISPDVPDDYFRNASIIATEAFAGHTIDEAISPEDIIKDINMQYKATFEAIVSLLKTYASGSKNYEFAIEGSSKILDQPEYEDVVKARSMLKLLESKEKLMPLLSSAGDSEFTLNIQNASSDEADYAVLTVNLEKDGVNLGKAGVIGPSRMDYSKVTAVLAYIGNMLSKLRDEDK
ncbi:MAG: heat-inducible transcription repressor HrcA [Clostridia bacterium]|nr:heat-inducible transcription repressor HrcA [Clostridia bacterium]MBP5593530.1 heat-inducible transcription repressor HrcA [Clostridia bacterium]MBP5649375.1 heat-inducible transcription repressor HrcA [Clostridia bacterium]